MIESQLGTGILFIYLFIYYFIKASFNRITSFTILNRSSNKYKGHLNSLLLTCTFYIRKIGRCKIQGIKRILKWDLRCSWSFSEVVFFKFFAYKFHVLHHVISLLKNCEFQAIYEEFTTKKIYRMCWKSVSREKLVL